MNNGIPLAVNLALTRRCNYHCRFCFGRLRELCKWPSDKRILEIPGLLAEAGCKKLTFEGGEPMLYPRLDEVIKKAKAAGLKTSVITNGNLVSEEWLDKVGPDLDWLGISIDSAREEIELELGRGHGDHIARVKKVASWVHAQDISLKVNTVVTKKNVSEDLTDTILELAPSRWKAFQVLLLEGENADRAWDLSVTDEEFESFVQRHNAVKMHGIDFVAEPNELMRGSYIMLLPDGRFFSNHDGRHTFGKSTIFEVGVIPALQEVGWAINKFYARGGEYHY